MVEPYTDYIAPPPAPHQPLVPVLASDAGEVVLRPNRFGHGFQLAVDTEGFGAGPVNNELTPRLRRRGAMLTNQRETEADMHLPIVVRSSSAAEVRRLVAELTQVLKLAQGTFRIELNDPTTGQTRYRDLAYREGLETPLWSGPRSVKFGITADYEDPWAYSNTAPATRIDSAPTQGTSGWVAPFIFPLVSSGLGDPQMDVVYNEGDRPAPLQVTFGGQVTEPRVRNMRTGAVVGVRGSLAWDERITVDAKTETVDLWRVGDPHIRQSVPGRLIRATRLTRMEVPPGESRFEFRTQTASNAFVEISAPSAFSALQ